MIDWLNASPNTRDLHTNALKKRPAMSWMQNPASMVGNARKRAREIAASAENQCPLSDAQKKEIEEIVQDARSAGSN